LARSPLDIQVLAVCGRNAALAERIREDNHAGVHVFGFVDNMPELLLSSDLLATRAGPGMIAEGLACGCPLLLTGYLPGQEEGNMKEVVGRQLGHFVPRPEDLVDAVTAWFDEPESARLEDVGGADPAWFANAGPRRPGGGSRARAAADPAAAFQIADVMVKLSA